MILAEIEVFFSVEADTTCDTLFWILMKTVVHRHTPMM